MNSWATARTRTWLAVLLVWLPWAAPFSASAAGNDGEARAILMAAGEFLARQPGFSVTIHSSYDTVQASGQKITFDARRQVTLNRPDGLRIEVEDGDGARRLIVFDGHAITIHDLHEGVYAQADAPGDIDAAVTRLLRDLGGRLPLAMLLLARLPAELEQRLQQVEYVERNILTTRPAHHLLARAQGVDVQVWVADGDAPLLQRIVLTYTGSPGQPQFRAEFADWRLAPPVAPGTFAFTPPADAERIPFLVRVSDPAGPGSGVLPGYK